MKDGRPNILLTNDDGIQSPGLWAAAKALSRLGYVAVVAPRQQSSGMGRSLPVTSDGIIEPQQLRIGDQEWPVYAVGGSPAQAVLHGLLEILPVKPDLVVSGINYGENLGEGISASGTVGAALEGASLGIPAIAVSLELADVGEYLSYSQQIDFSTAAYFTQYFARTMLEQRMPTDVDLLKIDVPVHATPQTPWRITRLSRRRYFQPMPHKEPRNWAEPKSIAYGIDESLRQDSNDTDTYTLIVDHLVSVTPISLDMTSRVDPRDLDHLLRVSASEIVQD